MIHRVLYNLVALNEQIAFSNTRDSWGLTPISPSEKVEMPAPQYARQKATALAANRV